MKGTQPKGPNPSMQKAIVLCAALVVCALIYLLVGAQTLNRPAQPAALVTPASSYSPQPTAFPGLRQDVVLERLANAGLHIEEQDDGSFSISTDKDDAADTLHLYLKSGYVRGFSLTLPALSTHQPGKPSKTPSPLEAKTLELLAEQINAQNARIRAILGVLLSALTEENYFSPSTSTAWAELCINVRESKKPVRETQGGISFSCVYNEDIGLTLSADLP